MCQGINYVTGIDSQSAPHDSTMKTMSPHAEPSPPPSPRVENREASSLPQTSSSRFASHFRSIPIFADTSNFLCSHSPRVLTTALTSVQTLAKPYIPASILNRADRFGDALLTQLEHSFPTVKSATENFTARPKALYEKLIARPATSLSTAANIYKTAGKERVGNLKDNLLSIYKTHAEPLLGKYTNEPMRRINNRFEDAVEDGTERPCREAIVEEQNGGGTARSSGEDIELYRSVRLVRNALERLRMRVWVPMKSMAANTCDDVKEGGGTIRSEVRNVPGRVRDGILYMRRVVEEETQREMEREGPRSAWGMGVGVGKMMYRVGERCVGEVVGVGLVVAAKGAGLLWGMWGLGKEKVKTA